MVINTVHYTFNYVFVFKKALKQLFIDLVGVGQKLS